MEELINELSSFDENVRQQALNQVVSLCHEGSIERYTPLKPWLNLHLHTFHSYNYNGWSPARTVFEGWRNGLRYLGTVDFDTIAGLEETLLAGEYLGVKVLGGFESRVFVEEMRDKVINSPNEPGIYYLCGKNFREQPGEDTDAGKFFAEMKETAQRRNRAVVVKLNEFLGDVNVDYTADLLSLTPSGNPTERHIVAAYYNKSLECLGEDVDSFWSDILDIPAGRVNSLRNDSPQDLHESLRSRLIKIGGPGYIKPEKENFPLLDDVIDMIEKAGGVPTATWLDGINPGEEHPAEFIEFFRSKGVRAVTIIPERNYNIRDEAERAKKVENLRIFMDVCRDTGMPVICGTEMNKSGQPFVDDFNHPVLAQYLSYFIESAAEIMD